VKAMAKAVGNAATDDRLTEEDGSSRLAQGI
jgi:hypothetical protein